MIATINKTTMTSREIADLTGKQHKNVLADCDTLNENYKTMGLAEISADVYKDTYGRDQKCFSLTKMQIFDLMTGYNTELRIKVNRRWEELEASVKQIDFSSPETVMQLVQNWADEEKKRIEAEKQIKALAPKVEYFDMVMQSESDHTTTTIAKELGLSAQALNRILSEEKIIFKHDGHYVTYRKYDEMYLTKTRTVTFQDSKGATKTSVLTTWTEKGRLFIHELVNPSIKQGDRKKVIKY